MFSTGKHPNRHLHAAFFDLILAVAAMCADAGLIRLDNPNWDLLPGWLWRGVAIVLLLSALLSYSRHRRHRP